MIGLRAAAGVGGVAEMIGLRAAAGVGGVAEARGSEVGFRAGVTGTTIDSGAAGLGLTAGSGTGAGAASTAFEGGSTPASWTESVCAKTRPLLRTLRLLIKHNPCINRGDR